MYFFDLENSLHHVVANQCLIPSYMKSERPIERYIILKEKFITYSKKIEIYSPKGFNKNYSQLLFQKFIKYRNVREKSNLS